MTILIDMDDVLEQLVVGWVEYINEKYGISADPEDVTDWNMALAFPTLTSDQVYGVLSEDDLWDHVRPMPGAVDAVRRLVEEGHQVYIVTASGYQTLRAKMDRVLFRYFPFLTWDQVIITTNKHLVQGDVLVDDGPHNLTGGSYRKILFDARHNRGFDERTVGAVRVHDWEEAYREILRPDAAGC